MKPMNMPARRLRRQLRSVMPKNAKVEPDDGVQCPIELEIARAVRTKIRRLAKKTR